MSKTFTEYKAIVEFQILHLKTPLEEAISRSDAPLHLVERLKDYFNPTLVQIRPPAMLIDQRSSTPLCQPLDESIPQPYTNAFLSYLFNQREWPRSVVDSLDDTSTRLVSRLPKPQTLDPFQHRGLVVGYIQSGKTANMAALIAKAADQGYRLFIILAGLYKDLRAQTQDRLDQEITGRSELLDQDSLVEHDPGVPGWSKLTSSGMDGDFRRTNITWDPNLDTPKLAVIKKHVTVMDNFTKWISGSNIPLENFPALVIDDEADQASINLKAGQVDDEGHPVDPSTTNKRIRELLQVLPKCSYVGFTATPFSNVLIDAEVEEDLYPRDFIAVLDEPENYFGPKKLFGLGMTPSALSPDDTREAELDAIRYIDPVELDELDALVNGSDCPLTLSNALLSFVLSCCARLARGQSDHFSMLVHPSHEKIRHADYKAIIADEIDFLKGVVTHSSKSVFRPVINRAEHLWNSDFKRVTESINDPNCIVMEFKDIWKFAKAVLEEIEILLLNSDSEDELKYKVGPKKRYVVIGGNRLSRGLTLEGLSVSLFLRDSSSFDTLLQMGRWFGYRKGYYDLIRVFVEERMAVSFADLARVEEELRADLSQYSREPNPPTPLELKPKIRAHPTLAVTSRLKMGAGRRINISLQHSRAETVALSLNNKAVLLENQRVLRAWIDTLGAPCSSKTMDSSFIWKDLSPTSIIDLIRSYRFSRDARRINREVIENYIVKQNEFGELVNWDVIIPRGNLKRDPYTWTPGIVSRKVARSPLKTKTGRQNSIRVLGSPGDIDLWREEMKRDSKDSTRAGLLLYVIDKKSGEGTERPLFSSPDKAEDVIGLTFVFPESNSNATIEYVTQEVD